MARLGSVPPAGSELIEEGSRAARLAWWRVAAGGPAWCANTPQIPLDQLLSMDVDLGPLGGRNRCRAEGTKGSSSDPTCSLIQLVSGIKKPGH